MTVQTQIPHIPRSDFFHLTPIPLQSSVKLLASQKCEALKAKLDKCRRHIARLELSLTFRRTDRSITNLLINEFKTDEVHLAKELANTSITEELGNLYRARMPIGIGANNESQAKGIKELKDAKITHLFLLCMDNECQSYTRLNLRKFYGDNGINVIHFPVRDYGAWIQELFDEKIYELHRLLKGGANVVVHCMGGVGRTGTIISAEAALALNLDADKAIAFARKHSHPGSVETASQKELVNNFAKEVLSNAKT